MKHHIVVKFLAVFLCAASLVGAAASGLGLLAATELGLGEKTLGEAYADSVYSTAAELANELAVRYASRELGSAPESLIDQYYGSHWLQSTFNWDQVAYIIRDENGQELKSRNFPAEFDRQTVYSIVAEGSRYLQILNTMTQDEYEQLYNPVTEPSVTMPVEMDGEAYAYTPVTANGSQIGRIVVTYSDGSVGEYGTGTETMGFLFWFNAEQLRLELHSYAPAAQNLISDLRQGYTVVGIVMVDTEGTVVLNAANPGGLLEEFSSNNGSPYVLLRPLEETGPVETGEIYDAIPPEGILVAHCDVRYADGYRESVGSIPNIGFLGYDADGYVVFQTNADSMEFRKEYVTYISFLDGDGNLVYEAGDYGSVGQFTLENNTLTFRSREPGKNPLPSISEDGLHVYDDVPPGGYAVYRMDLWLEGQNQKLTIEGETEHLGLVFHDSQGNIAFSARDWKDFVFSKPAQVKYILMSDMEGRVLYEAYRAGSRIGAGEAIGIFAYDANGDLAFRLNDSWAKLRTVESPEETVPETTAVPEDMAEMVTESEVQEETVAYEPAAEESEPVAAPTMMLQEQTENAGWFHYYDYDAGKNMAAEFIFVPTPEWTVEILLGPGALSYSYEWVLVGLVYEWMEYLIPALIVGLVLFAITAVYLCCAAGKTPGRKEIRAGGLNCLPMDLYLAVAAGGIWCCVFALVEGCDYLLRKDFEIGLLFAVLFAYGGCLLFVSFCFACAAQMKIPGGYLWRNTLIGRSGKLLTWLWAKLAIVCIWLWNLCRQKLMPLLVRLVKAGWKLAKFFWLQLKRGIAWLLGKVICGLRWLNRILGRFLSMLPLTWQFLLIGFTLVIFLYIMIRTYKVGYLLIGFGVFFGVILYAASAFGILLENTKRMRQGDLDSKVEDKLLIGTFREFAQELNGLADVAVVAAQKQLKSERMKTELITNVSHDIKTPLTSIINYVDLMEKPHSPEEQTMYLEVLSRQSQRLKKLVDDLMEMSKASTGNMAVEITRVNAVEAVNQALGEFADKLDKARLIPVFRQPEQEITMMADGRLVWRVLSNLLSNAVKYALPGTRLYIDLLEVEGKVVLSLKNISREPLNVSAEELLERFVRGDTARNTEGSGLGLNIAQSLMELQKGRLELLVDGDLFKVTLIFPCV